jgi:hypothetical protein
MIWDGELHFTLLLHYSRVTVKKLIKISGSAGTIPGGYPKRNHTLERSFLGVRWAGADDQGIRGSFKDPALKPSQWQKQNLPSRINFTPKTGNHGGNGSRKITPDLSVSGSLFIIKKAGRLQ